MRKVIINVIFVAAVFAFTLWSVFHGEDFSKVVTYLKEANARYIIPGIACVILYIMGEAMIIYYLLKTLGHEVALSHCCLYSFIGFFFSGITPSSTGGQPMQMIAMRKDKIPVAVSSVVLAIVTITFKLVLIIAGGVVLICRPTSMMRYLEGAEPLIYLGMFLNVALVSFLLLLVFCPNIVRAAAGKVFRLLHRIRPFHNPEKQQQKLENMIRQYEGTAEFFKGHILVIVNVLVLTFVQRFLLFLVTWFTYVAFGLVGHSMPLIVSLQTMISVATDMLPLPGGMGVSENLFLVIFEQIFGETHVLPGMVISRGISFYTQILISAIMTIVSSFIIKEKKDR